MRPGETGISTPKDATRTSSTNAASPNSAEAKPQSPIDTFLELNKPTALNSDMYAPFGGLDWKLPDTALWNEALGEDLCIVDIDNRPFDGPDEIFGKNPMSWKHPGSVHGLSLGFLNHYIYGVYRGPDS